MFIIKGFAVNTNLTDNTPGVNNLFGEPSTQSLTYSKEKGYYSNLNYDGIGLITFTSKEDDITKTLPSSLSDHALSVINFIYEYSVANAGQTIDPAVLIQALYNDYIGIANGFSLGIIESDGTYSAPDWVQWTEISTGSYFRVWFVDESFKNQYDEYELVFTPPFDNLDDFFAGGAAVEQLLNAITVNDIVEKLQVAKGTNPETFIKLETYDYHDPHNENRIVPSHWGILGYGIAGNNIDVIKDELIQFILDNSTHSKAEWAEILPDLFKRTEFVLVPLWDQYAIEPRPTTPGIFSPITLASKPTSILRDILSDYTTSQIDSYTTVMGFPYKSLSIAAVGNVENRDGKFLLTDYFPDFINVSSTSQDFNRMVAYTRLWSLMIHELVMYAENVTPSSSVPLTISKVTRDNILFLSRVYDNVQYLVATKYSIDNL